MGGANIPFTYFCLLFYSPRESGENTKVLIVPWAGDRTQKLRLLATEREDLSSIHGSQVMGERVNS